MDTNHFKELLLKKERELTAELGPLEDEMRVSGDVGDTLDAATADEGAAEASDAAELLAQTLHQVRDALARIENGSYGKCADCGRPIETARLEALPWALYCLKDQQAREPQRQVQQGSPL